MKRSNNQKRSLPEFNGIRLSNVVYWIVSITVSFLYVNILVILIVQLGIIREDDRLIVTFLAFPVAALTIAIFRPRSI